MNAELFVHGPRRAFYGCQEEKAYSQLFDSNQTDSIQYVVEVRASADGQRYAYYNYCRYAHFQDVAGRNGAYLGISLRLDAFYFDLREIYTILDSVFKTGAVGLLVKQSGNTYQYLVEGFEPVKQSILERIEKPLGSLLSGFYAPSKLLPIDNSFHSGQGIIRGLDDNYDSAKRLAELKHYGKIVFSSNYPIEALVDAQDKAKFEIAKAVDATQKELDKSKTEVETLSSKLKESENNNQSLCEKINQLEDDISNLKEENQAKNKSLEHADHECRQLKELVKKLTEKVNELEHEKNRLKRDKGALGSSGTLQQDNNPPQENRSFLQDITRKLNNIVNVVKNNWFFSAVLIAAALVIILIFTAVRGGVKLFTDNSDPIYSGKVVGGTTPSNNPQRTEMHSDSFNPSDLGGNMAANEQTMPALRSLSVTAEVKKSLVGNNTTIVTINSTSQAQGIISASITNLKSNNINAEDFEWEIRKGRDEIIVIGHGKSFEYTPETKGKYYVCAFYQGNCIYAYPVKIE